MQIYLPIAEMAVNIWLLLGIGGLVGFLSGVFGVGGGFLLTPLLIFSGVPPAVAVATGMAHILASSMSGAVTNWRAGAVDPRMGGLMLTGGVTGAVLGIMIFAALKAAGQIEIVILLSYVVLLSVTGGLMVRESARALAMSNAGTAMAQRTPHLWLHGLPLKMRFRVSRLYISAVPPVTLGFIVGFLAAIMGVGGGFIMVPAMIYLLRMPTKVVIGTSQMQTVVIAAVTTLLHAVTSQTVDIMLAALLIGGGVVGAQIGVVAGRALRGEQLRLLLGALVSGVGIKLLLDLVLTPAELYSFAPAP